MQRSGNEYRKAGQFVSVASLALLLTLLVSTPRGYAEESQAKEQMDEGVTEKKEGAVTIEDGDKVSIEYSLTVDGSVVDSSEGREPLTYEQGKGEIIPGLDRALLGLKEGDEKEVTVSPEDGYGMKDPDNLKEFPVDKLPQDIKPEVGMVLEARRPTGERMPVRIEEIKGDNVVLDFNHPLAGKILLFNVKIVSIEKGGTEPSQAKS